MMSGRGRHHTAETRALPGPDGAPEAAADHDEDATTPLWWVKTIASWTLLVAAVALLAALVVIPRLTGSTAYTVLTGSMTPTYQPGTLIVVKPTAGDKLKAGDVITFQPESGNPSVTTHRIISIVYDASGTRRFITKGDANNTTDPVQLVEEQIRGKLFYSVPYVGRINSLISGSNRSVLVFAVAGGLGTYALWMWISSLRDRKTKPPQDEIGAPPVAVGPPRDDDAPTARLSTAVSADPVRPGPAGPPPRRHAMDSAARDHPEVCRSCGAPWEPASRPLAYSRAPAPPTAHIAQPHPIPHQNH